MTQQTSPFIESKFGWGLGESGWNYGMDENLLKFSYLFDKNVNGIVSSLPAAVNGSAYFLTTDNRIYYAVNGIYYSTPVPKWFEFTLKTTGAKYQFDGTIPVLIDSPTQIDSRLDAVELTVSTLSSDLANPTDVTKGSALVGHLGENLFSFLKDKSYTVVSSISDLRLLNKNTKAFVSGYYVPHDGGEGQYLLDSSDTTTPDNGGTVIVAADGGRWKLITDGTVSVKQFGAKGDGTADDTPAFLSAINSGKILYVPKGTYKILPSFLPIVSNLKMFGDGPQLSIITWPQTDGAPGSLFVSGGDVSNVQVFNLGFKGNRTFQTTPASGQVQVAMDFRGGSAVDIVVDSCKFSEFGSVDGVAGGALFFGSTTGTNKILENITVRKCEFENISNVPGIYANAMAANTNYARNINILNNTFKQSIPANQNCVYILGSLNNFVHGVKVQDNAFFMSATIDTCIELNSVSCFSIVDNSIDVSGTATVVGILCRDATSDGVIQGNTLRNFGTGCTTTSGISLVRFDSSAQQTQTVVNGNTVRGWGAGFNGGYAIQIGAGSFQVVVSNNILTGISNANRTGSALKIANSDYIKVIGNSFRNASYAIELFAVTNSEIEENSFSNVGDGTTGVITDSSAGSTITGLMIRNNRVYNVTSGTPNFVSINPLGSTGNRLENNTLPSTVKPFNLSYPGKFEAVITPATTGALLAGSAYLFNQGSLSIPAGSGFTIGANLDSVLAAAGATTAQVGDLVLVAPELDTKGCLITANVVATNQIRIRVQNQDTAAVTISSGNWRVIIVKAGVLV